MKSVLAISSLVLCLLSACTSYSPDRIPEGVYQDTSGTETIAVTKQTIGFHVNFTLPNRETSGDREYEYLLTRDGKIFVIAPSDDTEFVYGILFSDWTFDGQNIVQTERRSGKRVRFIRKT